jgi:hypothetical protein
MSTAIVAATLAMEHKILFPMADAIEPLKGQRCRPIVAPAAVEVPLEGSASDASEEPALLLDYGWTFLSTRGGAVLDSL